MTDISLLKSCVNAGWTIANRRNIQKFIGKENFKSVSEVVLCDGFSPDIFEFSKVREFLLPENIEKTKRDLFNLSGINPHLISKDGTVLNLPRFLTKQMKIARKMNVTAIREAKYGISENFSKATAADYNRLTSETIEASYNRVRYVNPKDSKVYNILKEGETESGDIEVRILDENGAFVKNAVLPQKIILIPDNFTDKSLGLNLSHGDVVTALARRHNPFAKIVIFNIDSEGLSNYKELQMISDYLKSGNRADYISCSISQPAYGNGRVCADFLSRIPGGFASPYNEYDEFASKGVRVLVASGNSDENPSGILNTIIARTSKVEGVGSLKPSTGKISDFSASRDSSLTQHYEVGEYFPKLTKYGINISGVRGTDIPFPSAKYESAANNPLTGKTVTEVNMIKESISKELENLSRERLQIFNLKLPLSEITKRLNENSAKRETVELARKSLFDCLSTLTKGDDGVYRADLPEFAGTSNSAPIRAAKLALNDMLEGIL